MALPIGAAISLVGGLFGSKSPRYGGGDGPLYSTINAFLARANSGEMAVIEQVNSLRKTDVDKVQWQQFWDTDLYRANLTVEQRARMAALDPSKTAGTPQAAASSKPVASAPSVGTQIGTAITQLLGGGTPAATPGVSTPSIAGASDPGGMISAPSWFVPAILAAGVAWLISQNMAGHRPRARG